MALVLDRAWCSLGVSRSSDTVSVSSKPSAKLPAAKLPAALGFSVMSSLVTTGLFRKFDDVSTTGKGPQQIGLKMFYCWQVNGSSPLPFAGFAARAFGTQAEADRTYRQPDFYRCRDNAKVVRRYGRFTERSRQVLSLICYALGGEAGARLAEHIGLEMSADTVLRTLKSSAPEESHPPVRVIGVNDWAWRKGQHYGTILVDLERHKVVGLLPERSAESLAQWLKNEPSVEVVARDRAGLYAEGATKGAPDAVQVADRFHLLCNLTAAAERALQQKRFAGVVPPPPDASPVVESGKIIPLSQADQLKGQRKERRLERYNEVTRLYRETHSQKAISDLLGIQRKTICRLLRSGDFPKRSRLKRKPGRVDQFRSFLVRRWAEGCHNATQLWHEIREQGYRGARGMVASLVSTFCSPGTKYFRANTVERKSPKSCINPSASQVALLFSRRPETLSKYEQAFLMRLEAEDSGIWALRSITQEFSTLMRDRDLNGLSGWMHKATATGIPAMKFFVKGL